VRIDDTIRSSSRAQGFVDGGAATFAGGDIRPLHRRDRRPEPERVKRAEHLDVVLKAAFAQFAPSDLARGVSADEALPIGFGHGSSFDVAARAAECMIV
jgi:hypothetical protein